MSHQTKGHYVSCKPTLWNRLGFRRCVALTKMTDDERAMLGLVEGAIYTNVQIYADWKDIIRFAISGRAMVSIVTLTDKIVVKAVSESEFSVLPPEWGK